MRNTWDEAKNNKLKADDRRGNIGFETVQRLFLLPYYEDQKNDDPIQFRAIGWVNGSLYTIIFETRGSDKEAYRHLITFWPSTKLERKIYGKKI